MTTDERAKRNRAIAKGTKVYPIFCGHDSDGAVLVPDTDWSGDGDPHKHIDYTRSVDDCIEACGVLGFGVMLESFFDTEYGCRVRWCGKLYPLKGFTRDEDYEIVAISEEIGDTAAEALSAAIEVAPSPARSSPSGG